MCVCERERERERERARERERDIERWGQRERSVRELAAACALARIPGVPIERDTLIVEEESAGVRERGRRDSASDGCIVSCRWDTRTYRLWALHCSDRAGYKTPHPTLPNPCHACGANVALNPKTQAPDPDPKNPNPKPQSSEQKRIGPAHGRRHLISHTVLIQSFCNSQIPHESVTFSFIITNMKNRLTNLCGN